MRNQQKKYHCGESCPSLAPVLRPMVDSMNIQKSEEYLQAHKACRERLYYDRITQCQKELDLSGVPLILQKMIQCTGSDHRPSRLSVSALLEWEDNQEYIDQHKLGRNGALSNFKSAPFLMCARQRTHRVF